MGIRIRNTGYSDICRGHAQAVLLTSAVHVHVQLLPCAMHVHAVLVPHPDPVVGHIVTNHQARRTIRTCDRGKKQVNPF
jgi:hypothetical protein